LSCSSLYGRRSLRPLASALSLAGRPLAGRSPSFPLQPVQSAGVQSPLRSIGVVVPVGPPKWLPPPPPLTDSNLCGFPEANFRVFIPPKTDY
jgi:hypothetical protein